MGRTGSWVGRRERVSKIWARGQAHDIPTDKSFRVRTTSHLFISFRVGECQGWGTDATGQEAVLSPCDQESDVVLEEDVCWGHLQLNSTKTVDGKSTFLHILAKSLSQHFPDTKYYLSALGRSSHFNNVKILSSYVTLLK